MTSFSSFMLVQFKNVTIYLSNKIILEKIDLELYKNRTYRIIGENGAGKSVLMSAFLSLNGVLEGDIVFNFKKDKVCYIADIDPFYDHESVGFVIKMMVFMLRCPQARLIEILKSLSFDFYQHRHKKMYMLSKGMRRKLQLLPLFLDYDAYFLDEVFDGLDQDMIQIVKNRLQTIAKDKSLIFIEHHDQYAEDIARECEVIVCQNKTAKIQEISL